MTPQSRPRTLKHDFELINLSKNRVKQCASGPYITEILSPNPQYLEAYIVKFTMHWLGNCF
jgi:hypothetical protein